MDPKGWLKNGGWMVAAGAALVGAGLLRSIAPAPRPAPRSEPEPAPPPPQPKSEPDLSAVHQRIERLEKRVVQCEADRAPGTIEETARAAAENVVGAKIAGLDDRLTEQVRAIEKLQKASEKTDALLERLMDVLQAVLDQSGQREAEGKAARQSPAA